MPSAPSIMTIVRWLPRRLYNYGGLRWPKYLCRLKTRSHCRDDIVRTSIAMIRKDLGRRLGSCLIQSLPFDPWHLSVKSQAYEPEPCCRLEPLAMDSLSRVKLVGISVAAWVPASNGTVAVVAAVRSRGLIDHATRRGIEDAGALRALRSTCASSMRTSVSTQMVWG